MYRTFNMGIGMILVVAEDAVEEIQAFLAEQNEQSFIIGKVTAGEQEVVLKGGAFDEAK